MNNYIQEIYSLLDKEWLKEHIINLFRLERKQTYPYYHKAAEYVDNLLKAEGFDSELIEIPADGKQVYQDKRTPIGWDVSNMRLTLQTKVPGISDPVISDYQKDPLMAVKHSVSLPEGGFNTRIVTESQMKAGEDVRDALVLLDQSTHPRGKIIEMVLDLGAIGWVSDYSENPTESPNSTAWSNFATETHAWHTQSGERDYVSYLITPKTGYYLRRACENGYVPVLAESDGRRYEATLPVISGLLPGESEKEVWILAHMYEPLIDDNINGVIGSIAILKALRTMQAAGQIQLKYSVRVVFASEMYGFAAAAEYFGGDLSKRAIGAINIDGVPGSKEKGKFKELVAKEGPDQPGFVGNVLVHKVWDDFEAEFPEFKIVRQGHYLGDDCFLGDATIGLPVVMFKRGIYPCFHHNAVLDESYLDVDICATALVGCGGWVRLMASLTEQEIKELLPTAVGRAQSILDKAATDIVREGTDVVARMNFLCEREKNRIRGLSLWSNMPEIEEAANSLCIPVPNNEFRKESKQERPFYAALPSRSWYDYAEDFVFGRVGRGFPHDQVKLELSKRRQLPGFILYDEISEIFSRMDGEKTLKTLINEVEWDKNIYLDDARIKSYLFACTFLAETGYLTVRVKNPLTIGKITEALKNLGISEGETVLVHSSLSGIGYVPGGEETILKGLLDAVGNNGTVLAAAFSRPYVMFDGEINKTIVFRPYDTRPNGALRDKTISTGALPKYMLKQENSLRSGHATHEWVAIGKDAKDAVSGHGLLDPPAGETSPLAKALKKKGSVVFFGCSIASNTFLHYLEEIATDIPKPGVIQYIDADGERQTGFIARQYPGNRDFYYMPDSRFYAEAVKRGLKIHTAKCGIGTLYRMELENLYDVGMEMIRENPYVTVGDKGTKRKKF